MPRTDPVTVRSVTTETTDDVQPLLHLVPASGFDPDDAEPYAPASLAADFVPPGAVVVAELSVTLKANRLAW